MHSVLLNRWVRYLRCGDSVATAFLESSLLSKRTCWNVCVTIPLDRLARTQVWLPVFQRCSSRGQIVIYYCCYYWVFFCKLSAPPEWRVAMSQLLHFLGVVVVAASCCFLACLCFSFSTYFRSLLSVFSSWVVSETQGWGGESSLQASSRGALQPPPPPPPPEIKKKNEGIQLKVQWRQNSVDGVTSTLHTTCKEFKKDARGFFVSRLTWANYLHPQERGKKKALKRN